MYRRSFVSPIFHRNTLLRGQLALIWIAGLSLGVFADRFYGEAMRACVAKAVCRSPDFFGAVCVNVLPLMICAYAFFFLPRLLDWICMIRAVLTGMVLSGVVGVFASAGGLIAVLLLFGLLFSGTVLVWYWIRRREDGAMCFSADTGLCMGFGIVIACVDSLVIGPFLAQIMMI